VEGRVGVLLMTVQDFGVMVEFYRDTLGFPVSSIHPGEGYQPGIDWIQFALPGGCNLELFAESRQERPSLLPLPRNNAVTIAFIVEDFPAARDELASRGVEFHSEGEQEWGWYAHFRDPEGNELQIYKTRPGY
jgi:catechol 2,3-dioxygenase-like lactoylglutathione lyase family enzyme